jgi:hypothetical protein
MSIHYPIDPAINNNGTPIFIARPTFIDMDGHDLPDPVLNRTEYVGKKLDFVTLPNSPPPEDKIRKTIKKLRHALGLADKKEKLNPQGILTNPDPVTLRNEPFFERGFVYLPIGSNPYCYYHPQNAPDIIYNFKGEPPAIT